MVDRMILGSCLIVLGAVCCVVGAFRVALNHRVEFLLWFGSGWLLVIGGVVVLS